MTVEYLLHAQEHQRAVQAEGAAATAAAEAALKECRAAGEKAARENEQLRKLARQQRRSIEVFESMAASGGVGRRCVYDKIVFDGGASPFIYCCEIPDSFKYI
jgi:hypothetical protein